MPIQSGHAKPLHPTTKMQQRLSNFLKPAALLLMLLVLLLVTPSVDALFGKLTKKKKQQEEKVAAFTGTESAGMGLDAFQDLCKYRDWMIFCCCC